MISLPHCPKLQDFMEYYMIPGFVVIEVISVDAYGLHGLLTFTIAPPSMGKASQIFLEASFFAAGSTWRYKQTHTALFTALDFIALCLIFSEKTLKIYIQ